LKIELLRAGALIKRCQENSEHVDNLMAYGNIDVI